MRRVIFAFLAFAFAFAPCANATITSSANKVIVAGTGSQTVFGFGFIGVNAADIIVLYTDASGNQTTLVRGPGVTQYQLTLNAAPAGQLWGIGGSVTYNPSGTPIASGTTLTIYRNLPLTQTTVFANQGANLPNATEQALDTIEMQLQQVAEAQNRVISAPISDPSTVNLTLPPAAQRANTGLLFDGSGNVIAGVTPATGTISSAMAPVVGAASLAAGRTAFGLGALAVEGFGVGLQDDGAGNARVNGGTTAVSINQSISGANHNATYIATGPINFSLPRANTLFNGFGFWVHVVGGGVVTIIPNAADTIKAQQNSSGTNATIPVGTWAWITTDAASSGSWYIGGGVSGAVPLALSGFVNLAINNNAGNPDNSWDISADEVVMVDTSGRGVRATSVAVTIAMLSNGANGLDTGSMGNAWYNLFVISNGTTTAGLASLSATAPTMPSGYSFKKRVGAIYATANNAQRRIRIRGRSAQYLTSAVALPSLASSFGAPWQAVAVASFVPPTAGRVKVVLQVSITSASNTTRFSAVAPSNTYATAAGTSPFPPCSNAFATASASAVTQSVSMSCDMVLESTNVYVGGSGAATINVENASVLGWEDNL
jgi:hypothetical protein